MYSGWRIGSGKIDLDENRRGCKIWTNAFSDRQTDRHTKYSFVESGMEKSVESYIIKIDGHERKKFAFQTT